LVLIGEFPGKAGVGSIRNQERKRHRRVCEKSFEHTGTTDMARDDQRPLTDLQEDPNRSRAEREEIFAKAAGSCAGRAVDRFIHAVRRSC
jgi:hypothetical protein